MGASMLTIQQAIDGYLHNLAIGQSPQTVETYSQGLKRFREYLESKSHSPTLSASTLTVDHALGFALWLSEDRDGTAAKIGKSTLRTYLTILSRFYSYLLSEQIVDLSASAMRRMSESFKNYRRGYERPLPKLPPEDAIHSLLNAAREIKPNPKKPRLDLARLRNIAMLESLRAAGMRVGELVGLRRDDLDYRQQSARVTGKGSKQRIVYFDDAAWGAIQTYLRARGDGARGRALYALPLFSRHDRRVGNRILPLTTDSVRLVFNQIAHIAGIEIAMTPHSLRHAFATRMLESSGDLALVQDMMGHSSPVTTRIYAKVSSKRMREAHRAAFGYDRRDREDKSD